jgi:ribose transport system substrate-binding protein
MNRRELLGRTALLGLGATLGSKVALDPRIARGAADPAAALAQLASTILVKDVNGVAAAPISVVKLGDDELAKIKGMNATAAIVMHYGGNDWSRAQIQALQTQLAGMGVKVIAVTDAGFKAEKQMSDIETVLTQKPSIIIGVPVDPAATARAFKAAADQGVKVVFANFAPSGLVAGKDYVSVVSADEYGNGVAAALLLVQALGGKGEVGLIYHAADFHVTRQRYEAVKATLKDYPDVKVVAEQGIGGPDFPGDAEKAASAMLTSHRRIKGIWAVWDVPAEGVISAARTAGRDDLVITTIDLGENVAIDMASGGFVKGLGAQRVYDQGVTEALLAGYGLLGKEAPPYVASPALPTTKQNLLEAWQTVYHAPPTAKITKSMT